jgi:hypothetical protein
VKTSNPAPITVRVAIIRLWGYLLDSTIPCL